MAAAVEEVVSLIFHTGIFSNFFFKGVATAIVVVTPIPAEVEEADVTTNNPVRFMLSS